MTDRDKMLSVLEDVMRHAIVGDPEQGFHTYCSNPEHALAILESFDFTVCNIEQDEPASDAATSEGWQPITPAYYSSTAERHGGAN